MNISSFSVQRPVFISMVVGIVVVLGGIALERLPVDLMPEITYPTLSVITSYENAGPEEIESLVTRPIEQAVSAVPGVKEVTSASSEGSSSVRVSFTWGANLDEAANDMRDRLDRVLNRLPEGASRPSLRKFDLAQFPVLILGVTSHLSPIEMRRMIEDQVRYRLERQPGVAAVDIFGGLEQEIHVDIDADKLKALGLSFQEIIKSLKTQNINLPIGTIKKGNYDMVIRSLGEFSDLQALKDTTITVRDGVPIQLKEIASVTNTHKKVTRIVRINGSPGIRMAIRKQAGSNTVEVTEFVLDELEKINTDIAQLKIIPLVNTADYIKRSITSVSTSAMFGGLFAIGILLVFLRNFRSTLIIATVIPITILATFVLVYSAGFTLNLMTLGGLAVGVGMIVDNAIVVLENIYRLRNSGSSARQAAILGSDEVRSAIIASTLTTLVIFLPLIFVRGMAGVMFKQLAYVISFALICSLLAALTVIPMLASRLLEPSSEESPHSFLQKLQQFIFLPFKIFFEELDRGYQGLLAICLRHRSITVAVTVGLLGMSFYFLPFIGVELMPSADEGEVRVNVQMDVGTSLEVMNEKLALIESRVKESVPEAKNMIARLGASSWRAGGSHTGSLQVTLKASSERKRSSAAIAADLRKKLTNIPGVSIRTRPGRGLFIFRLGSGDGEKIQIEVRGHDLMASRELADQIKAQVENVDGVTDVRLSQDRGRPEERVLVDRDRAADMQLTISEVANTLQAFLSGILGGMYRDGGQEFDIRVKVKDAEMMSFDEILDMTVINAKNQPVVLKNVVQLQTQSAPMRIERKDQERVITVSVNISERDMGSVLADIRQSLAGLPIPRDTSIVFGGDYDAQQEAFQELLVGFLLASMLVYMVLACLYESLRDPFLVMFAVPFAAIGVLIVLFLTRTTFNVQSYIGCIMLGGIVVNNAILLVDYINLLRKRDNMPVRDAIIEAGRRRLRPILMTALTTILAMTPLAMGWGEGSETQVSLARVVIGGLASSSLITLVFIPVLYDSLEQWFPKTSAVLQPSST
ncbi:MAG: efflux RND transporter permease subunit [SAR324 cluster bacterium]|nr:efflux RND transporter permease subunit [SAR324 cluster bacterium]